MIITETTTLKELKNEKNMAPLVPYMLYNSKGDGAGRFTDDSITLQSIQKKDTAWQAQSMAYGLNTYLKNTKIKENLILSVYDKSAADGNPELWDVKLIYFPADRRCTGKRKTVLLAAGGAYGAVCSLSESFPAAAKLSESGADVFCLNYTVADGKTLFPRPMEDLSAAVRFLIKNSNVLDIDMTHYAVGGFSAGAHLAACYGTEKLGYIKYNLPKPELMILVYPLINIWKTTEFMPEVIRTMMRRGCLGEKADENLCSQYNVDENVTDSYPPTWMIQSADDMTVPVWNTELMEKALKEHNVLCRREIAADGGHGWGLGDHTAANGWTERVMRFWEEMENGETK